MPQDAALSAQLQLSVIGVVQSVGVSLVDGARRHELLYGRAQALQVRAMAWARTHALLLRLGTHALYSRGSNAHADPHELASSRCTQLSLVSSALEHEARLTIERLQVDSMLPRAVTPVL
eukprot:146889-Prymnesium_polylepis.1